MAVTGLMLWFPVIVTKVLPRWTIDVALTIHYYEAILACLAILVWHYHVILDPTIYPINWAFWDGLKNPGLRRPRAHLGWGSMFPTQRASETCGSSRLQFACACRAASVRSKMASGEPRADTRISFPARR